MKKIDNRKRPSWPQIIEQSDIVIKITILSRSLKTRLWIWGKPSNSYNSKNFNPKIHIDPQKTLNSQSNLEERTKLSDFKLYYKA